MNTSFGTINKLFSIIQKAVHQVKNEHAGEVGENIKSVKKSNSKPQAQILHAH